MVSSSPSIFRNKFLPPPDQPAEACRSLCALLDRLVVLVTLVRVAQHLPTPAAVGAVGKTERGDWVRQAGVVAGPDAGAREVTATFAAMRRFGFDKASEQQAVNRRQFRNALQVKHICYGVTESEALLRVRDKVERRREAGLLHHLCISH